jgi:drug/metabolite transporter (DMT)-like permease
VVLLAVLGLLLFSESLNGWQIGGMGLALLGAGLVVINR